jgi:integration host factor subunit alpha
MTNADLISRNYRPSAQQEHVAEATAETKRTVTRSDLADAVFRRIGLSRLESAQLVETVIEEIGDAILRGENVKLSSFGTFMQRSKRERIGRNPKTGVEATITPRQVLVFKASHIMRARINGDNSEQSDTTD